MLKIQTREREMKFVVERCYEKRGWGQSAKTVTPSKFSLAYMFTTIMKSTGIRGKNLTLPPGAGSSHYKVDLNF